MSDYTKAIEINPKYAEVYYNRGNIYDNQGNLTQALSDYNKAIEINPNIAQVYSARAVIYYRFKKYKKAWADVRKAQELGAVVDPQLINALKQTPCAMQRPITTVGIYIIAKATSRRP